MTAFRPSLDIRPTHDPMGFQYGEDCFGPKVEKRQLDNIRKSLLEPDCKGPETVYAIAMDVGKTAHKKQLKDQHLLFGVVTFAKGQLGKEPVRSQGHIHKKSSYADGWSTPEVYQIWSGKAVIFMQETAQDDPGRCFAVYAGPGDIVIVPPAWAHATISADPQQPLTFGAWCDRDYGFEYDEVRAHQGLAWYPIVEEEQLKWNANKNYQKSALIEKPPESYEYFGIKRDICIYQQYERDKQLFSFVPLPYLKKEEWREFIP